MFRLPTLVTKSYSPGRCTGAGGGGGGGGGGTGRGTPGGSGGPGVCLIAMGFRPGAHKAIP